jgi:hypothetical protein
MDVFLARMITHQDSLLIYGAGFNAADKFFFSKRLPRMLFIFLDNCGQGLADLMLWMAA